MQNTPKKHFAGKQRKKAKVEKNKSSGHDEVLLTDINNLLKRSQSEQDETNCEDAPQAIAEKFTEMDVKISELSSTGDGLALSENGKYVYVVRSQSPATLCGSKW